MTREVIQIESQEAWLELRKFDLTSTMMAGVLGLSPYCTPFELYHAKRSGIHVPFEENERVKKGKRGEQYCAEEVSIKTGMEVRKIDNYVRIPNERMGSSFDYEINHPDNGWGILELKMVDYFQFKNKFIGEECPDHMEIQLQHQLECSDQHSWGMIAVFTGVYDFIPYERERDKEVGKALRVAAKKFWHSVDNGIEPKPDFYRDHEVLNLLYANAGGEPIDRTNDDYFESIVSKYNRLGAEIKAMEADREAAKAEIHRSLENAGGAFTSRFKVTAGWTKGTDGTLVTPEMVGTRIGARKGYRQCLVKDITRRLGEES